MSEINQSLPDPRFDQVRAELRAQLRQSISELAPAQVASLLDPTLRWVVADSFKQIGAHEGTVWWLDEAGTHLVPVYNSGPNAARIVGQFRQPLSSGLICMVFATEQPFIENAIYRNSKQSKLLDQMLQVQTCALVAVPLVLLGGCRGVISCVQLKPAQTLDPDPPGFGRDQLIVLESTAALLSQLLEFRLLTQALGWS